MTIPYASAQEFLAEKLTLARKIDVKRSIGTALCLQGQLAFLQREMSRAYTLLTESITLLREMVASWTPVQNNLAEALSILGRAVAHQGDLPRAYTLHEESLVAARYMMVPQIIALSLEGLAETVVAQDKSAWAVQLRGAAESLREAAGTPLPAAWRPAYERTVARARTSLGEQVFSVLWATGRTLPLEEVLADREPAPFPMPVQGAAPPPVSSASAAGLTPREMDVLGLLAQGLTNAQIAEQLVIGLVTVNFHVRSIYSKLEVTSRAAATRYALEHHLLGT